jgi:branched-chain amino acid transport system permease protein
MLSPALLIGCTYALLAVGYAVAYSCMNMINFAHGEVMMIGGLIGYLILELGGAVGQGGVLLFGVAMAGGGLAGAIMAYLIQRSLYRPLRDRGRLSLILAALGASMFLQQLAFLVMRMHGSGSSERRLVLESEPITVAFGLSVSEFSGLLLLAISIGALAWLVQHTMFGVRLRAIAFSPDAMKRLKQPVDITVSQAFAVGGFVAGAAGVVYAKQYTLTPYMGFLPGMKAFLACIVGGRTIFGAVLGGFAIGITEGLLSGWLGADWRDIVGGTLMIALLVFRPDGLFSTARPRTL